MNSDNPQIGDLLKDNKNIIYIPKDDCQEHIIVRSLDETVNLLDGDWEVVTELDNDMFLMRKSFKLETAKIEL